MDRAASTGFEGIAQMLLEQKKLMDALEAENRELRRQLADLRRGVGIAVVIEGKTVQLAVEGNLNNAQSLQSLQGLQPPTNPLPAPNTQNTYTPSSTSTNRSSSGSSVNLNGEKRENNNARSPLADSFVL